FPDVSGHVKKAVSIGRKASNRCCSFEAVALQILPWEVTLPGVCHEFAAGSQFISPDKIGSIQTAACGELPFRFGGQFLAGPFGICLGIFISDMHYRMLFSAFQ